MNISASSSNRRAAVFAAAAFIAATLASAGDWSEPAPVLHRGDIVMTYRARVVGDWLIVEASHDPEWHTYAMDNVPRAREATGKQTPETELPTRIAVTGGLKVAGPWKQSPPKDLSKPDIQWYTWGFEGTARFAVKVERVSDDPAVITVNAQSCNASLCSMVRDLRITLAPAAAGSDDSDAAALIEGLVDVAADPV